MLDLKYKPETVICVDKPGVDDFSAVLCSVEFLRQNGVELPEKGKNEFGYVSLEELERIERPFGLTIEIYCYNSSVDKSLL